MSTKIRSVFESEVVMISGGGEWFLSSKPAYLILLFEAIRRLGSEVILARLSVFEIHPRGDRQSSLSTGASVWAFRERCESPLTRTLQGNEKS